MKSNYTRTMKQKLYSLALATSMIFSSCMAKNVGNYNKQEYPWTGGTLSIDELIIQKKKRL